MFKNLKKKLTAILSLGLVLSTGAVMHAEAQEPTPTPTNIGSITINAPTIKLPGNEHETPVELTGMIANAYQVLKEDVQEADGDKVYTVTDGFKNFFATAKDTYTKNPVTGDNKEETVEFYLVLKNGVLDIQKSIDLENPPVNIPVNLSNGEKLDVNYFEAALLEHLDSDIVDKEGNITSYSKSLETMSNWLTSYVANQNPLLITTGSVEASDKDTSITIDNLPDGYYLVSYDKVPQGIAVERSLVQVIDGTKITIDMKADTQYVTKQVKHQGALDTTYADYTSANMSDTLTYKITMPVTQVTNATRVTSGVLTDTIQHHTFKKGTLTMKVVKDAEQEGQTEEVVTYSYTGIDATDETASATFTKGKSLIEIAKVEFGTDNNNPKFTITFTDDGIADLNTLAAENNIMIVVTYDAVLGADAVNDNVNTAEWTLKKDPYIYKGSAVTNVYTYGININKTFSDNLTSTHAGSVQFEIYSVTGESASKLKVVKDADGDYHVDNTSNSATTVLTPNNSGNLVLTGLKAGTYTLKEVGTATGFQLASDTVIKLTPYETNGSNGADRTNLDVSKSKSSATCGTETLPVSEVSDGATDQDKNPAGSISLLNFTILNQKGFNLPSTGGAGTWMFAIGGILLFAGAGALLVAATRKKHS